MISDISSRWLEQLADGQDLGNGFYACYQGMTTLRWIIFGLSATGVFLALLLLLFNSAVEASLTAINRLRLQSMLERYERRVVVIENLLDRPNQVLSAINTLNTICLIAITALTITAIHQFNLYGPDVTVGVLLVAFLILVLVRTVPKGFAMNNPEGIAVNFAGYVNTQTAMMSPLVSFISFLSNLVLKMAKVPPIRANSVVSEEELTLLANVAEEEGIIQNDEREMIRSIFEFGGTIVREVMIPRLDIKAIPAESNLDETLDIIISSGHSRLPIYHEDIDHIAGILYAKDLLRYLRDRAKNPAFDLEKLLRPVHYVPESKKVDELFAELQNKRVHIAVIIDEYGGTAGLVTIEDLLEEIVGEIQDEYDLETTEYERINEDEFLVDARLNLSDVNDFFHTHWESENVDTIGGFLYDSLERIPAVGDQLIVTQNGEILEEVPDEGEAENPYFIVSVLTVEGQRLKQLRLERKFPPPPPEPAPTPTTSRQRERNRDRERDKERERETETEAADFSKGTKEANASALPHALQSSSSSPEEAAPPPA